MSTRHREGPRETPRVVITGSAGATAVQFSPSSTTRGSAGDSTSAYPIGHSFVDPTLEPEIDREQLVADEPHREVQLADELALPSQQPVEKLVWIVVRVVLELVDLVEDQDRVLRVLLQPGPDSLEDAVQSRV